MLEAANLHPQVRHESGRVLEILIEEPTHTLVFTSEGKLKEVR